MLASPHDLSYFVELSSTLNFSRASERIGISQPSLSVAIKRLEQAIGTELFIRSKNGVTLTQAGKRLLSHTKQLLQLWDSVKTESLASHFEVQGNFTFGCHQSVALHMLPAFLPELLRKYPKLEIQLKHDLSRKMLEGIINLSIDIGIIVNPIKHPDLVIHKLYTDKVTFWQSTKKTVSRDQTEQAIICDPNMTQTEWLLKKISKTTMPRLITSSSLEVIASLTANQAGIGILPASVATFLYPKLLMPVPNMPSYQDEICLVYRHENRHIKAIQVIIEAIKHRRP
ncbi:MAG: LysR family transcriptional regulator [Gammaproteobacteria bacterium]